MPLLTSRLLLALAVLVAGLSLAAGAELARWLCGLAIAATAGAMLLRQIGGDAAAAAEPLGQEPPPAKPAVPGGQEFFHSLIEHLPASLYVFGVADLRVLNVNAHAEREFGVRNAKTWWARP